MAQQRHRQRQQGTTQMTIRTGTSHFVSIEAATKYYRPYDGVGTYASVVRRVEAGEIHIGPPTVKAGQTVEIIDNGTRYAIVEA